MSQIHNVQNTSLNSYTFIQLTALLRCFLFIKYRILLMQKILLCHEWYWFFFTFINLLDAISIWPNSEKQIEEFIRWIIVPDIITVPKQRVSTFSQNAIIRGKVLFTYLQPNSNHNGFSKLYKQKKNLNISQLQTIFQLFSVFSSQIFTRCKCQNKRTIIYSIRQMRDRLKSNKTGLNIQRTEARLQDER